MGLRYRPSAQADLADHAAGLALLANDLADIPAEYLDRAIRQWARENKFMPRASELAEIAQGMIRKEGGSKFDPHAHCRHGNAHLAELGRSDLRWIVVNGQPTLEQIGLRPPVPRKDLMDRRGEPMTEDETDELNQRLEGLGATARYRPDGSKFTIGAPS